MSSCVSFIPRLLSVEVVIPQQVSGTERRAIPRSALQTTRELDALVRMLPEPVAAAVAARGSSRTREQREDAFSRAASGAGTGCLYLPLPIRQ